MTPKGEVLRIHVSLPAEAMAQLRQHYPKRKDATVIREAVARLVDPTAQVIHLPEGLRIALEEYAAAHSQSIERAAVSLLRDALAQAPTADPLAHQLSLVTFSLLRQLVLLAVGNDVSREAEIVAQAQEWSRQQLQPAEAVT